MEEENSQQFEQRVRDFLNNYGFENVGGGPKFRIGGIQVDACGGKDEFLVIIDATTTKSNVTRKITEMRGKLTKFKTFEVENDGVELPQYRKYKEILLAVATNSLIDSETQNSAREGNPKVYIWDKHFFDYYSELKKLIKNFANFQLLGELGIGTNTSDTITFPATRIPSQTYSNIYSFVASPQDLLEVCYVARRESGDEKYYQRLVNAGKLNKIAAYIGQGKTFANNIIVALPKELAGQISFKKEFELKKIEFGELTIPKTYRSLWIIDGQHRLYGYSRVKNISERELLQVTAIENITIEEQRELFIKINREQSPVQMDLLWDLYSTAEPNNEKTGVLSRLAKHLDTLPQFRGKIYYPLSTSKKLRGQISISKICNAIDDSRLTKGTVKNNVPNPLYDNDVDKKIKKVAKGINEFYEVLDNIFGSNPVSSEFYNKVCLNSAGVHIMLNLYSGILSVVNRSSEQIREIYEQYVRLLQEYVLENFQERKQIAEFLRSSNSKEGKRDKIDLLTEGINLKIGAKGLNLPRIPVSRRGEENRVISIEKNLRAYLDSVLSKVDPDWLKTRTPPDLYNRLRERSKGEDLPLRELLTLGECIDIILRNDNVKLFEERIKSIFYSIELFKEEMNLLKEYRNSVDAHDRMITKDKENIFLTRVPNIIESMNRFLKYS